MRQMFLAACFVACGAIGGLAFSADQLGAASNGELMDAYRIIARHDFVDLTHTFGPGIAHWPGFPNETVRTLFTYKKDGFFAQMYCHVGQWGTHVDPPAHFAPGGMTVDQIEPKRMFLPLAVIDVHAKVARNPDYVLSMDDVRRWESAHGQIPTGAFVVMRTDWSKRWPSETAMENRDAKGVSHYPGWSLPVLQYLYLERHAVATGHETTDTDPGAVTSHGVYPLESWILRHGHYQIELLTNLDRVPESGSLAIVTFPKPSAGSGFPARVIAIVP